MALFKDEKHPTDFWFYNYIYAVSQKFLSGPVHI